MMHNIRVLDQTEGEGAHLMRDSARPFVVVGEMRQGYRSGGGSRLVVLSRWETRKQANAACRREEAK